jgi:hypothetical protein
VRPQRQDASQLRTPVVSGHGRGRPCAAACGMAPNPPAVRSVPIRSLLAAICHCPSPPSGAREAWHGGRERGLAMPHRNRYPRRFTTSLRCRGEWWRAQYPSHAAVHEAEPVLQRIGRSCWPAPP